MHVRGEHRLVRSISSPARSASHAWQCQDAGQRRSAARELQGGVLRRVPRGCGVQSRRFRCGVGAVLAQVQYRRREAAVVRRCFVLGDTRMNIDITPVSGSGSNEERPASLGSREKVACAPTAQRCLYCSALPFIGSAVCSGSALLWRFLAPALVPAAPPELPAVGGFRCDHDDAHNAQ